MSHEGVDSGGASGLRGQHGKRVPNLSGAWRGGAAEIHQCVQINQLSVRRSKEVLFYRVRGCHLLALVNTQRDRNVY